MNVNVNVNVNLLLLKHPEARTRAQLSCSLRFCRGHSAVFLCALLIHVQFTRTPQFTCTRTTVLVSTRSATGTSITCSSIIATLSTASSTSGDRPARSASDSSSASTRPTKPFRSVYSSYCSATETLSLMCSFTFCWCLSSYTSCSVGIAARVVAIYEPPQLNTSNSFELLEVSLEAQARAAAKTPGVRLDGRKPQDASASASPSASASTSSSVTKSAGDYEERLRALRADEEKLDKLLDTLGLTRVGCIFTDLVADVNVRSGVQHFRGTPVRF